MQLLKLKKKFHSPPLVLVGGRYLWDVYIESWTNKIQTEIALGVIENMFFFIWIIQDPEFWNIKWRMNADMSWGKL